MKRFFLRATIYLSPLMLALGTIAFIDPYYLFHPNRGFNQEKYDVGYSFDQGRRYKIFKYLQHPSECIILGASEINLINELNIPEKGWHSLSYGGAPLQESLRMFWVASEKHSLKKVLIAPEFIKYFNAISSGNGDPYYANFNWEASQSVEALDIFKNKLKYFVDKYTLKSTWQCIVGSMGRGKPQGDKNEFWKHQMEYARKIYMGNEVIASKQEEIKNLFIEIHDYCIERNIEVIIVLPIQHTELLRLEYSDKIFPIYKDYIQFLTDTFGQIEYMAFTKDLSNNAELFSDPFHFTSSEPYIEELFGTKNNHVISDSTINQIDEIQRLLLRDEK